MKFSRIVFLFVLTSGILATCVAGATDSVIVPKGAEIMGELVTPVNSKNSKVGDPIIFKVAKNFIVENAIILPKGTNGTKFKFFVAQDTDLKVNKEELSKYFYVLKK